MISLKEIKFTPANFNYYFKIILFYRNDNDYCRINNNKKVIPKESFKWLKKNQKDRIFLIIKYKNRNVGMFNFNKIEKTFSAVIKKEYRNLGLGGFAYKLLFVYLKSINYKDIVSYALKTNIQACKINLFFSYKNRLLKNNFTKFYIKCG